MRGTHRNQLTNRLKPINMGGIQPGETPIKEEQLNQETAGKPAVEQTEVTTETEQPVVADVPATETTEVAEVTEKVVE